MAKSYNDPFEHVDFNAIIDGTKVWGVKSGLAVTERGAGQNMSVDVASGTARIDDVEYVEASTVNVVITAADATHPRKDIIIYDAATTNPTVVTGTPAAEPIPPDITSGDILLAIVNITANDTTIANTDIEDGRVNVAIPLHAILHSEGEVDEMGYYDKDADNDLNTNATERSTAGTSYTKLKETKIDDCADTIAIRFSIKNTVNKVGFGKIYRNGIAVGSEVIENSGTGNYVTYNQTISGWSNDDLIQLYIRSELGFTVWCKDLIIRGENKVFPFKTENFTDNS